jgi:cellulose synthase/poly-beta-1,6-N-acetylglucosamine synthase-like glycosyltransferase
MEIAKTAFIYSALFIGIYFQIFLLLSFLDDKEGKKALKPILKKKSLPTVSVMVPCFNEETTVVGTVESLLALDYPTEKLFVLVIDDGSTDRTWDAVQVFAHNPQVRLLQKQNEGSKFAALNFGLTHVTTEIVGCLDADSHVDRGALMVSIREFRNPDVACVVPTMLIDRPQTFFQRMQKVEYEVATYVRRVFSLVNALYIAPGPFTLFRKSVFDKLGPYKEAHHTEDLEIALRMQVNGMKIIHALDAVVYTKGPRTWGALLRQRVRWTYGFLKNAVEYRFMFFRPRFGNLGFFVLPCSIISIGIGVIALPLIVYGMVAPLVRQIEVFSVTHTLPSLSFDPFFINTKAYAFLSIITLGVLIATLYISRRRLLHGKFLSFDIATIIVYPYFASLWMIKSVYNMARSKKSSWR